MRGLLQRQLPQGVALLPKHVWLLEPPAPTINPIIWAAVGIAALTVMLTVSKQLRSGVGESQARGPEATPEPCCVPPWKILLPAKG